jgi:hypothetical protein
VFDPSERWASARQRDDKSPPRVFWIGGEIT